MVATSCRRQLPTGARRRSLLPTVAPALLFWGLLAWLTLCLPCLPLPRPSPAGRVQQADSGSVLPGGPDNDCHPLHGALPPGGPARGGPHGSCLQPAQALRARGARRSGGGMPGAVAAGLRLPRRTRRCSSPPACSKRLGLRRTPGFAPSGRQLNLALPSALQIEGDRAHGKMSPLVRLGTKRGTEVGAQRLLLSTCGACSGCPGLR